MQEVCLVKITRVSHLLGSVSLKDHIYRPWDESCGDGSERNNHQTPIEGLRDVCDAFLHLCDCAVTVLGYDCIRINRVHDGSNSWSVLQRGELMICG
jgi:hypothetical protein